MQRKGLVVAFSLLAGTSLPVAALAGLEACSSSDATGTTAGLDGAPANEASPNGDGATSASDGGDAGISPDAGGSAMNGEAGAGDICGFNHDCMAALRCECEDVAGCACKPGARGTGKNGIDPCTSGSECTSSLCIEGPPDSGSFCSDECMSAADCTGKLPQCSTIAGVGRVCIRQ